MYSYTSHPRITTSDSGGNHGSAVLMRGAAVCEVALRLELLNHISSMIFLIFQYSGKCGGDYGA